MALVDFFPMTTPMRAEQERALHWIERCVLKGYRDIVVAAPTGCHGRWQKVLRYDGRAVPVEEVRIGDLLMGPDSMPRKVLNLVRGEGTMYCCQSDIGSTFSANDQHVLSLNRRSVIRFGRSAQWHKHGHQEITLAEYLKADAGFKARYRLWRAQKPIQFPETACTQWYGGMAYETGFTFGMSGTPLPREAMVTSVQSRRDLLAGLLDACGTITENETAYAKRGVVLCRAGNNEVLDSVAWLTASLGWAMNRWMHQGVFYGTIMSPLENIPLRRLVVPITSTKRTAAHRGRLTAINVGKDKFFGFTLDRDGLYLLDDFVVQHNSGKTAMGIAFANWMAHGNPVPLSLEEQRAEQQAEQDMREQEERNGGEERGQPSGIAPGAYYLCTQKLLQDQITDDIPKLKAGLNKVVTLKTAAEYPCAKYGNCAVGAICKKKGKCPVGQCAYQRQKAMFLGAHVGITNYAYLMTERAFSGMFPKRRSLVCDEAHNVATTVLKFVELSVNQKVLDDLTPGLDLPKRIDTMAEFTDWVRGEYVPALTDHLSIAADLAESGTDEQAQIAAKIDQQLKRISGALATCGTRSEWVFWDVRDDLGKLEYIARPVEAAPFAEDTLLGCGQVRLYMSAFPGVKDVFARDLGLQFRDGGIGRVRRHAACPAACRGHRLGEPEKHFPA